MASATSLKASSCLSSCCLVSLCSSSNECNLKIDKIFNNFSMGYVWIVQRGWYMVTFVQHLGMSLTFPKIGEIAEVDREFIEKLAKVGD